MQVQLGILNMMASKLPIGMSFIKLIKPTSSNNTKNYQKGNVSRKTQITRYPISWLIDYEMIEPILKYKNRPIRTREIKTPDLLRGNGIRDFHLKVPKNQNFSVVNLNFFSSCFSCFSQKNPFLRIFGFNEVESFIKQYGAEQGVKSMRGSRYPGFIPLITQVEIAILPK